MQEKTMRAAVENFILQRINACGSEESQELQVAREELEICAEKLNQALSSQQKTLYRQFDNALAVMNGETTQCYYRAGFADAVLFLLGWRDGNWN